MLLSLFLVLCLAAFSCSCATPNRTTVDAWKEAENERKLGVIQHFQEKLKLTLNLPGRMEPTFLDEGSPTPREKWLSLPYFVRLKLGSGRNDERPPDKKELVIPAVISKSNNENWLSVINLIFKLNSVWGSIKSAELLLEYSDTHENRIPAFEDVKTVSRSGRVITVISLQRYTDHISRANVQSLLPQTSIRIRNETVHLTVDCVRNCATIQMTHMKAYLVVIFSASRSHLNTRTRFRRDVPHSTSSFSTCSENSTFCCKRSFKIRPSDIGWNWIVEPDEIQLNYCFGMCNDKVASSEYSKILAILLRSSMSNYSPRQMESMRSCCAPRTYSGLNVTYLTGPASNNLFERRLINNLLVNTCGCL